MIVSNGSIKAKLIEGTLIEDLYKVVKEIGIPHFRNIAKQALDIDLPDINKQSIKEIIHDQYLEATDRMFSSMPPEDHPETTAVL